MTSTIEQVPIFAPRSRGPGHPPKSEVFEGIKKTIPPSIRAQKDGHSNPATTPLPHHPFTVASRLLRPHNRRLPPIALIPLNDLDQIAERA